MRVNPATRHNRRGLTLIEVLLVIFVIVLLLVLLWQPTYARASARQIKCATQVRNTIQAMTTFAQSNRGSYPLPSRLDPDNQTVAETGRAKDTTNNILSVLVFNGSLPAELLYCPSETNTNVRIDFAYQNARPKAAVNPVAALWDPGLRCDFTTGEGHISYATLMTNGDPNAAGKDPARARLKRWGNSSNTTEAVYGNRGPAVTGERDSAGNPISDKMSNTLAIHGGRTTWEGNIAYNDGHVAFETRLDPKAVTYQSASGAKADILFYDEPDDADGLNAFLGIWVKAGNNPSEFKGIHD